MPVRVSITRRALREIDAALDWLAERSPAAAARWHRRLLDAIDSLESNPERCSLAPESDWFAGGEIRQLLSGKRGGV
jgi:plasmid stabilization system protein ParE